MNHNSILISIFQTPSTWAWIQCCILIWRVARTKKTMKMEKVNRLRGQFRKNQEYSIKVKKVKITKCLSSTATNTSLMNSNNLGTWNPKRKKRQNPDYQQVYLFIRNKVDIIIKIISSDHQESTFLGETLLRMKVLFFFDIKGCIFKISNDFFYPLILSKHIHHQCTCFFLLDYIQPTLCF